MAYDLLPASFANNMRLDLSDIHSGQSFTRMWFTSNDVSLSFRTVRVMGFFIYTSQWCANWFLFLATQSNQNMIWLRCVMELNVMEWNHLLLYPRLWPERTYTRRVCFSFCRQPPVTDFAPTVRGHMNRDNRRFIGWYTFFLRFSLRLSPWNFSIVSPGVPHSATRLFKSFTRFLTLILTGTQGFTLFNGNLQLKWTYELFRNEMTPPWYAYCVTQL